MNTCQCPYPPGGQVTCEDDQLAICDEVYGASCYTPPSSAGHLPSGQPSTEMDNWALGIITERRRAPRQAVTGADRQILESGEFVRSTGKRVTFAMPKAEEAGGGLAMA